jgi:phosphatidylglycerophosphate synthase
MRTVARTGVTPNQVTTASLAMGLLAALLYAQGAPAAHLGALCFVVAFWLDHADGELARLTGRTSAGGHYYDIAAGGTVLVALFIGIGAGLRPGALEGWGVGLALAAAAAIAVIFVLRMELERRLGKAAVRQPRLFGFELEDVAYLVAPITWLDLLPGFVVLAGIGTPVYALVVLWQGRARLAERSA